jgi:hypothetical protein
MLPAGTDTRTRSPSSARLRSVGALAASLLAASLIVPRAVCSSQAGRYFDRDAETELGLARRVARRIREARGPLIFHTGQDRFDGQSAVAIYQMALLGMGQIVLHHPEAKAELLPAMRVAADRLADPATLRYAASRYGRHAAQGMGAGEGHAYAGYINMGLGMMRVIDPETRHGALNDRLTSQLAARLDASPHGLIETYPGETWPPDVAAVAASIGLHAAATGADHGALLDRWSARYAPCAIDASGYLVQRTITGTCKAADAPRGSGTAVASYFLSFAAPALSKQLHASLVAEGYGSLAGFAAVREFARGHTGKGDVNAGPIVLGFSVGATGFGIGAAAAQGDRSRFVALASSAHLFGLAVSSGDERAFAAGGVLGDALLLAMLTARKP